MDSIYWTNDSELRESRGHSYFQYLTSAVSLILLRKTYVATVFFLINLLLHSAKVLETHQ